MGSSRKFVLEFLEPILGTLPGDKEVATDFVVSKHPEGAQADEKESQPDVEEKLEKASTFFARTPDKKPILYDYLIKGFFKEACEAMINTDTIKKEDLKGPRLTPYLYKKTIDKQIFVFPRQIRLQLPDGVDPANLSFCERPLRGQTMRGERICLARSEMAPAGTKITIEIMVRNEKLNEYIPQWLDYGALSGLGQWRNGS